MQIKFKIGDKSEVGHCKKCGVFLDVGDWVYSPDEYYLDIFCSKYCLDFWKKNKNV